MKVHTKYFILSLIINVLLAGYSFSQTKVNFTNSLMRDDNAYKSRSSYEEWNSTSSLYLGYSFDLFDVKLRPFYNADFSLMANNSDLNNNSHLVGLSATFDENNYIFRIAANAKLRNYDDEYVFYNVNSYFINANLEYVPDISSFYSLNLLINNDKYQEIEEIDNFTYRISTTAQKFFQSKFSITAEAGLGVKNYVNQDVVNYYGIRRFTEEPLEAAQISLSTSVGKSIVSNFGIKMGLGGQWFIGDPIEVFSNGIYYVTENDLMDDPYSYENLYGSLELTQQFAIDFQGKIGYKYQNKNYSGTDALDATGETTGDTRQDNRSEYFLQLSKKFHFNFYFPVGLSVFFNYMYRDNPSNDPYYEYQDNIGLIGISIGN